MQRTVKGLKVTVAQAMIVENGEVKTNVFQVCISGGRLNLTPIKGGD